MNKDEIRKQYHLLDHEGFGGVTEIFGKNPFTGEIIIGFFDNVGDIIKEVEPLEGQYNLYIGVNPRSEELFKYSPNHLDHVSRRAGKADVIGISGMFLDIDPERDDAFPATDDQNQTAIAKASELSKLDIFKDASVCSSGNGAYVFARLNFAADLYQREQQLKALVDQLRREHFQDPSLRLDSVHALNSLMALMGTLKVKGQQDELHPYRQARFITSPPTEVNSALQEAIVSIETTKLQVLEEDQPVIITEYRGSVDNEGEAKLCQGLQKIYDNPPAAMNRSMLFLQMFAQMKRMNWSRELISRKMLDLDRRVNKPGKDKKLLDRPSIEGAVEYFINAAEPRKFSCETIHKLLGNRECAVGCPYRGTTSYPLAPADNFPVLELPDLAEGRKILLERLEGQVSLMTRRYPKILPGSQTPELDKNFPHRKVLVVRAAPGLGKNYVISQLVKNKKTIWFTPRLEELGKIVSDLRGGREVQVIRSKEKLCRRLKELAPYRQNGFYRRESEVCRGCEYFSNCEYYAQFDPNKSWVMASSYLTTPILHKKGNDPELVILDENCLSNLLDEKYVTANDLVKFGNLLDQEGILSPDMQTLISRVNQLMLRKTTDAGLVAQMMMEDRDTVSLIKRVLESEELKKYRAQTRTTPITNLPTPNIDLLLEELGHDAQFPAENTRLGLGKGRIVIRRLHSLDWLCKYPIIILDASASEILYSRVFPDHKPEMYHLDIRRRARVVQITDVMAGRRYLKDAKHMKICLQYIKERAEGKVGIICHKMFQEKVEKEFPDAIVKHYGQVRGSRDFEDCDSLFLLGGAFVSPEELIQQTRAVFRHDSKISDTQVKVSKNYGMTSNNFTVGNMHQYEDERLKEIVNTVVEEEMRQAAYRIRPLEGEGKVIYVLSNVPIPGLPPDELDSIRNLKNTREAQFIRRVKYLRKNRLPCSCKSVCEYLEIPLSTGKRYWSRLPSNLKKR